ncbi:MAG TPA: Flp family type IVb pilin [Terracidiphilus sp.]|nr:Flp family type IVb pilin [Terracidiphilus sp.]
MSLLICRIRLALHALLVEEEGQDLVEYAMIVALMALGALAGMNSVSIAAVKICDQLSNVIFVALG